jgi:acetyl esterase/lipase
MEEEKDVIKNGMICFIPGMSRRSVKIGEVLDIPYRPTDDADFSSHKHKLDIYLPTTIAEKIIIEKSGSTTEGSELDKNSKNANLLDSEVKSPSAEDPSEPYPVVIFVHGGGWQRGHRRSAGGLYQNVGRTFATMGYISVVPSYRLTAASKRDVIRIAGFISIVLTSIVLGSLNAAKVYTFLSWWTLLIYVAVWLSAIGAAALVLRRDFTNPEDSMHPRHANDVADAIAWTQKNIAKLGGDPKRLFFCGHSAGGHLVSLISLDQKYLNSRGFDFSGLVGVISISGVYCDKLFHSNIVARNTYMPRAFGTNPEKWPDAFALNHVRADAPPFLLLNASIDIGLADHARALEKSLKEKGIQVQRFMFSHTNHVTIVSRIGGRSIAFHACGRRIAENIELMYLAICRMFGSSVEREFEILPLNAGEDSQTLQLTNVTVRLDAVSRACSEFISQVLSTPHPEVLNDGEFVDDPDLPVNVS